MAKQTINLGTSANKGDGDPLRTAFDKVNDNFDEVYSLLGAEGGDTDDVVAPMLVHNDHTNITVTRDDDANKIIFSVDQAVTDLQGSVFADDSTLMVDAINQTMFAETLTTLAVFGNPTLSLNADSIAVDAQNGNLILQTTDTIVNTFVNGWEVNGINGASMVLNDDGVTPSELSIDADVIDFGNGDLTIAGNIEIDGSFINNSVSDGTGLQVETASDFEIKVDTAIWSFEPNDGGRIQFPDGSTQTTAYTGVIPGYINTADLKTLVAASTDFEDFQARIAAL